MLLLLKSISPRLPLVFGVVSKPYFHVLVSIKKPQLCMHLKLDAAYNSSRPDIGLLIWDFLAVLFFWSPVRQELKSFLKRLIL